jgi:hypothetical protein
MNTAELEQTVTLDFVTSSPTTGDAETATSVTVRVFEETTDVPILTPTATERSGYTGNYRVQVACTTANGFEEGKSYSVVAEAIVEGVAAKAVISNFRIIRKIPRASVVANGGNTATTFKTDLTESINDYWKDALVTFVTGSLAGQVKKVLSYDGTTKFLTFLSGYTAAPTAGDKFQIINA